MQKENVEKVENLKSSEERSNENAQETINIAIEGCCHGDLDIIYDTLSYIQREKGKRIDLLICCGDFQAVRNEEDLNNMSVKQKYREMKEFHKYYSGEKVAPFLTLFIGGNHEASNHLYELPYGGWVAPNIYYMGFSTVLNFGGIRIAGLTGIFKGFDFEKGHYEKPPFNESDIVSFYHVREMDVFKLQQLKKPLDIFVSHDWPRGIIEYGNKNQLHRYKPFIVEDPHIGNPTTLNLMKKLKPSYWFCAHMHAKFPAIVPHEDQTETKFLALGKVLPKQEFLQVISLPYNGSPKELYYDAEWLAVLVRTKELMHDSRFKNKMPNGDFSAQETQIEKIARSVDLKVPLNFVRTASSTNPDVPFTPLNGNENPQTIEILKLLDSCQPVEEKVEASIAQTKLEDPEEIDLDLGEDDDERDEKRRKIENP
eukprot:TRINITY_DN4778_c0_g1_i1.p1 TRINITY_DN4778_c0_g1~~TRINITY_DN4778_c0_g1_i1.p1  ORF type:complete len:445 (+),score=133.17 TRINITY_DN4778_c0_g1_i1:59-1336(+)